MEGFLFNILVNWAYPSLAIYFLSECLGKLALAISGHFVNFSVKPFIGTRWNYGKGDKNE